MGLLFGKKKKGEEDVGPIRKGPGNTEPRGNSGSEANKRVRVAEDANMSRSASGGRTGLGDSGGSSNGSGGSNGGGTGAQGGGYSGGGGTRGNAGGTSGGGGGGGGNKGTTSGLDSNFSRVQQQDSSINFGGNNKAGGGGGGGGGQGGGQTGGQGGGGGANNSSGNRGGGGGGNNGATGGFGGGGGGGTMGGTMNSTFNQGGRNSPLDRVVNLYGISLGIFNITRAVLSVQEWNDPLFIQLMEAAVVDLERELHVIKDADKLRDWVHPLHYRKTGSVIGAGRRIQQAHKYFMEWAIKLKQTAGEGFGPAEQRQFKDTLKEMVRTFVQLLSCCEMVVSADFNSEINELARTMRDVVDTASGKLNYVFDDVARICTTCSIRLSRLALWKSLQVSNIPWARSANDTCYTVTKATKVLYIVGERLYRNMTDQAAYDNLTALTKGVVMQIKKLQGMVQAEPPEQKNVVVTFTPEVIQEHTQAYDQGIKEVSNSLSVYVKKHTNDLTVVGSINKIISQLEAIKNTVKTPDNSALVVAVASISDSVEKFCGATYHALYHLDEENEVLKEQIMETMQHILHCTIQLQVVAVTKGLYFTIINPEATMLTCLRSLLLSVSIIIDAIDYMKADNVLDDDQQGAISLLPEEINEAIVYILHYGRPLYKGEGEEPEEQFDNNNNSNVNSNNNDNYNNNTTTTTTTISSTSANNKTNFTNINNKYNNNNDNDNDDNYDNNDNNDNNDNDNDNNDNGNDNDDNDNYNNNNNNDNDNDNDDDNDNKPEKEDTGITLVVPPGAKKPNNNPNANTNNNTTISNTSNNNNSNNNNNSARGAPSAGAGDLSADDEALLSVNPDDYNENNVPPGWDPAPAKPVYVKGSTQEQYKAYMVLKYEYETWENKLILHKLKLKKQIEELKAKKGIK